MPAQENGNIQGHSILLSVISLHAKVNKKKCQSQLESSIPSFRRETITMAINHAFLLLHVNFSTNKICMNILKHCGNFMYHLI